MLDVLCPLITESDNVSSQLLDIILINIVEPQKSSKKNAYHLAKELIIKTNETMEQYIQQVIGSSTPFSSKYAIGFAEPQIHIRILFFVCHSSLTKHWSWIK